MSHLKKGVLLLKKYISEIKLEIFLQIVCSMIESLALAGLAYLPKVVFDSLSTGVNSKFIFVIIAGFCMLSLVSVIAGYLGMKFNWKYAIKFENSIKKDYFNAIIQYDDIMFHKRDVSDYISIQSNDIMQIEQDYLTPLISATNQIIKVIIFGLVMFLGIDWRIASVIFIASIITAILPKYTGEFTSPKRLRFVNQMGKYTNLIYDFFTGFREINSRTAKQIIKCHADELNSASSSRYNYGKAKSITLSINSAARTMVQILGFITVVVLLVQGKVSIGTGVVTFGFINSFIDPLEETLYCFTMMETVRDVKNKVFEILEKKENNLKKINKDFQHNLELKNLCSHNGSFQVKDISFVFQKNKHYVIIGNNGSGKTTLLNSIMGYLPIDSGKMLMDGCDLSQLDLAWLVTYVLQRSHIFSTNYNNNVTMFQSYRDLSDELIRELSLSQELVNKIKTQDESTSLSGGEKQIVAYIRARNSETPILIMDEPFSAVDKHSKQLLMKDIASLQDKTVIMITHDVDESLNYFDEIIKVNNGRIVK